jgi:FKBP-type peptidyl-prolyl cis-trans isomerase
LAQGGKAKFILPSHLAYGLTGDQDKIPPQSPVVYDIELIEIEKNEK